MTTFIVLERKFTIIICIVDRCLFSFSAESFVFQLAIQILKININTTIILPFVLYGCET